MRLICFALNGRSRDGTNGGATGFVGGCRPLPLNVYTPAETRRTAKATRRQAEFQDDMFHSG
jgi:hypothetical protein